MLSLYICSSEVLKPDRIEPVPVAYSGASGSRHDAHAAGRQTIALDPYPFDQPSLTTNVIFRRLTQTKFKDSAELQSVYFKTGAANRLVPAGAGRGGVVGRFGALTRQQKDLADRAAAFDGAMRLRRVLQRERAVDTRLERAVREPAQDIIAALATLLRRGRVGVQSGARKIDGACRQQLPDVERRYQPARFAVKREQATRPQASQALLEGVLADRVIDDVDTATARHARFATSTRSPLE